MRTITYTDRITTLSHIYKIYLVITTKSHRHVCTLKDMFLPHSYFIKIILAIFGLFVGMSLMTKEREPKKGERKKTKEPYIY